MKTLYSILILLCISLFSYGQGQSTRIELNGGKFIIESFSVQMVGDSLRIQMGDLKIMNEDSPTVNRFNVPLIFAVPSRNANSRDHLVSNDYAGTVKVTCNRLEEKENDLEMDLEIEVRREAMSKRQSWLIIPELSSADTSVTFAGVLINGKIKEKHFRRKLKFRNRKLLSHLPDMYVSVTAYTDTLLRYSVRIPYEMDWMDDASLTINQILTSSADKEQLFVIDKAWHVKIADRIPYEVMPAISFIKPEKTIKQRKMSGQAYLDFQVGRSVLLPDFRRNPEELAKIDAIISTVVDDEDITLHEVRLCGYASPEGSWQTNDKLSKDRAQALKKYIQDKFSIPERLFSVTNVPEDWERLREMVEESSLAQKNRVIDIIDNVGVFNGREAQLLQLDGGRPWRIMLTEMFPDLRRVEYEAVFTIRDYDLEEANEILKKKPQNLSLYEIYELYNSIDPEYRSNQREAQPIAEELFDIMITQYPEDKVAIINYAGELLRRGDTNGARRYLDKVLNDPLSLNVEGVYWLLVGDLEKAESYFITAIDNGYDVAEAEHNLSELNKKREDNLLIQRIKK